MACFPSREELDAMFPSIGVEHWGIDPTSTFLNHGSFGACPTPVLQRQNELRLQLESNPLRFMLDEAPDLLKQSKETLAGLLNTPDDDLVFVQSATAGVNAVLRSIDLKPGDEILVLDQTYRACRNIVDYVCKRTGAVPVVATIRWPGSTEDQVVESVLSKATDRTAVALIDHINSSTGMLMPIQRMVASLNSLGIDVLIDGAHALGQVEVDLSELAPAYYVTNCHKWLCGPKAAAVLYVRPDRQGRIEPAIISHGSRDQKDGRYGSFQERFAWQGTADPTPAICAGAAARFLDSLMPGGLPALIERNHEMAVGARDLLCKAWSVPKPCPDQMIAAMASMPVCKGYEECDASDEAKAHREFVQALRLTNRIECQALPFGMPPVLHIRLSCHAYNHGGQLVALNDVFSGQVEPRLYTDGDAWA